MSRSHLRARASAICESDAKRKLREYSEIPFQRRLANPGGVLAIGQVFARQH
jgi:hypothetical protein